MTKHTKFNQPDHEHVAQHASALADLPPFGQTATYQKKNRARNRKRDAIQKTSRRRNRRR